MSKIHFKAGKENIVGKILGKNSEKFSDFILFHGAGKSTKERAREFFEESIFDVIPNLLTFDFSGHGESSGELQKSSLKQRVLEGQRAIELFSKKEKITLCGSSMGGYVALKMLPLHDVKNLILFAPAIYDIAAFDIAFDGGFTEILRKPESWKNSDAMELLEKFSGNLLLFIGNDDEVIPNGVIDLIDQHSVNVRKKEIVRFDACPHSIFTWLDSNPREKKRVIDKISEYYLS